MTEKILGYTRHPASAVWPDLEGDEWDKLFEGVKRQGLLQPILATKDNAIYDGWQRLRACKVAGIPPVIEVGEIGPEEISQRIIGLHAGRRHLGASELARLILETRMACGETLADRGEKGDGKITRKSLAEDAQVSEGTAGRVIQEKKQELNPPDNPPDPFEEDDSEKLEEGAIAEDEGGEEPYEELPDPNEVLQAELEETQARLEDANERLAILEDGVSPESKSLIDDLNNKAELITTLRSQLNEKTAQLNEARKEIAALKRRVKKLEA